MQTIKGGGAREREREENDSDKDNVLLNSGHLPSLKGVTNFYASSYLYYTHLAEVQMYKHIFSLSLSL